MEWEIRIKMHNTAFCHSNHEIWKIPTPLLDTPNFVADVCIFNVLWTARDHCIIGVEGHYKAPFPIGLYSLPVTYTALSRNLPFSQQILFHTSSQLCFPTSSNICFPLPSFIFIQLTCNYFLSKGSSIWGVREGWWFRMTAVKTFFEHVYLLNVYCVSEVESTNLSLVTS